MRSKKSVFVSRLFEKVEKSKVYFKVCQKSKVEVESRSKKSHKVEKSEFKKSKVGVSRPTLQVPDFICHQKGGKQLAHIKPGLKIFYRHPYHPNSSLKK